MTKKVLLLLLKEWELKLLRLISSILNCFFVFLFFSLSQEQFLQDAIFNKFDIDRSGSIDFAEFVKGMSVMTKGSPEEKLEAAFRMYDLDGI